MTKQNTITQNVRTQEAPMPEALSLGTAEQAQIRRWLHWVSQAFTLPSDWISFSMFTIILAVLGGGLMLHIHLSSQIYRTQLEVGQLEVAYDEIAHQNTELIWQISQFTSLNSIHRRAETMGYVPVTQQFYVAEASVRIPTVQEARTAESVSPQSFYAETARAGAELAGTNPDSATTVEQALGTSAFNNLRTNPSHSPVWVVRMQQRMANVGQRMQNWWQ